MKFYESLVIEYADTVSQQQLANIISSIQAAVQVGGGPALEISMENHGRSPVDSLTLVYTAAVAGLNFHTDEEVVRAYPPEFDDEAQALFLDRRGRAVGNVVLNAVRCDNVQSFDSLDDLRRSLPSQL